MEMTSLEPTDRGLLPQLTQADDPARREQLDAMKRRATSLLVLVAVIFLGAMWFEPQYPWLAYVRATAEAALVGGLADWFAVTALFKHPLGIPIPHTAIIATRKERIGRVLGNFVQNHFLTREVIGSNLRAVRPAKRAATWLSDPMNARLVARHAAKGIIQALDAVSDDSLKKTISDLVTARLRATRAGPALGKALAVMLTNNRHQALFNTVIRASADAVHTNQNVIRDTVHRESPWWLPSAIDDKIFEKIIVGIDRLLTDIETNPDHQARAAFDAAFRDFINRLQYEPEAIAQADALKDEWLSDPAIADASIKVVAATRRKLQAFVDRGEEAEAGAFENGLAELGTSVLGNEPLLAALDDLLIDLAAFAVENYRQQIGNVVATTVASWEPEATSRRFELAVGRDLQFVRINGTLVGGLVGLLLYIITHLRTA
jgi:uncharacterized membrane-anchored protein YjiN (DUF445 family)